MNLADDIIDRQRLRRRLSFWRIATGICALLLLVVAGVSLTRFFTDEAKLGNNHIAEVDISGTIFTDDDLLDRLADIAENDSVKAMILKINSPGGTTTGGEAIYEAVAKVAAKKPVVSEVGTLAASAGYMIAVASDHIVARKTSIVGSIGVLFQYPNAQGLLETVGIDMRAIKSSPIKAEPNFYGTTPPEAEAMIRAMILDSYAWFKGIVAERRQFSDVQINRLADGSVYTGRQSLDNGLVDALGGRDVTLEWLASKEIDAELPVIEWKSREAPGSLFLSTSVQNWLKATLGLDFELFGRAARSGDRLFLDGLLSLWQIPS